MVFKKKEIVLLRVIENTKTGKDLVETNSWGRVSHMLLVGLCPFWETEDTFKSSQIWNHLSDIFILEGFHIENLIKNTNDSYSIGQITENVTFLLE